MSFCTHSIRGRINLELALFYCIKSAKLSAKMAVYFENPAKKFQKGA